MARGTQHLHAPGPTDAMGTSGSVAATHEQSNVVVAESGREHVF